MTEAASRTPEPQTRALFGVAHFRGKVAFVAGAEHPLGVVLSRRLAGFGATVVALGSDERRLMALAETVPGRIEPLALRPGRRDVLELLQQAWAADPLDILIDVMPVTAGSSFSRSAGLAAAMAAGLRAAGGRAVMAIPLLPETASPDLQGLSAGYRALLRRFAEKGLPARFIGLGLPGPEHRWTGRAAMSAADAALMLCHPVSRALRPGSVVELSV